MMDYYNMKNNTLLFLMLMAALCACSHGEVDNNSVPVNTGPMIIENREMSFPANSGYGTATVTNYDSWLISGAVFYTFKDDAWVEYDRSDSGSIYVLFPDSHDIVTGYWIISSVSKDANNRPTNSIDVRVDRNKTGIPRKVCIKVEYNSVSDSIIVYQSADFMF